MERRNHNFKVFVSSTFEDLKEYRRAVIEQLNFMQVPGITMEYFGSFNTPALDTCLKKLEECNVYIGIIGHRYGTKSPVGDKSFVQCEYEKAMELNAVNKIKPLIYLANQSVSVPFSREEDSLFEKQKKFREEIKNKHTPPRFDTPDDLAKRVSADLFTYFTQGDIPNPKSNIFSVNDDKEIEYYFDSLGYDRSKRIQHIMDSVVESLRCLFVIDSEYLDDQPFLKRVRDKLSTLIPGVIFDDSKGVLQRTNVRHVIFRTETISILLRALIENKSDLSLIGEQIGSTAARDLIINTVEAKQLIPDSSESLIKLWNFWDRTGGWGNISLHSENDSTWTIKIENNFLKTNSPEENHEFCYFWCGYIKGFLNSALPSLSRYMGVILNKDELNKVKIPLFIKVDEVIHRKNSDNEDDFFDVIFKAEDFATARILIIDSEHDLEERNYATAMRLCQSALKSIEDELDEREDLKYRNFLSCLTEEDQSIINKISEGKILYLVDEDVAKMWLEFMKRFIDRLAEKKVETQVPR